MQGVRFGVASALLLLLLAVGVSCRSVVRRDVSHLPLEYLPPVVLPPVPSRDYLPPVEEHAASLNHVLQPPRDYLPPVNNEYLPPVEEELQEEPVATTEVETAVETTAAPTTEAVTEAQTEAAPEPEAEIVTEPVELKALEHIEEELPKEQVESAVLLDDGYHYRKPQAVPNLLPVQEYLPPLDDNAVVEEIPEHEEDSSALLDDGYHYRTIRRLRF
ncbi:uncharacterized protein LOC117589070 [Drosophila guanche]|uniref:DUF4794 domain-containing protein n=1 Tax=Drosophila guanche TaxID=7266 RepID=A0A3B0KT81_DROGU|nr:uncharacterized protein LOC117589070 [Drosophila guanche]SPP87108.1 Hypothetical predicted protein [Drosophila guanche]